MTTKIHLLGTSILFVLEIQRLKSVKACRPKARQAKVNANSSTNSLITGFLFKRREHRVHREENFQKLFYILRQL
ncbi:MAG: hypothetical protein LBP59_05210 [Planctomycetaceae bacterium]|nr:hypothetical protein [Planctomycetaceae bacterium]